MRLLPLALVVLLSACAETEAPTSAASGPAGSTSAAPTSAVSQPASGPPVAATCRPPAGDPLPEAQGPGLWALMFQKLVSGTEIKIVLRSEGSGLITVKAFGPNGKTIDPVWGPAPHLSSTWDRPGDEYGTGWIFPEPGCWIIRATRSTGAGEVGLLVS